jgi:hypothetical protein
MAALSAIRPGSRDTSRGCGSAVISAGRCSRDGVTSNVVDVIPRAPVRSQALRTVCVPSLTWPGTDKLPRATVPLASGSAAPMRRSSKKKYTVSQAA